MDQDAKNLWTGVVIGFIVMIVFAVISIDVLNFIPLLGPFVGGLVAGYIVDKDIMNAGKAGMYAAIFAAIVVSLDFTLGLKYMQGATMAFVVGTGWLVLIATVIYFALLGFIGGAIGWMVKERAHKKQLKV
jgi:ABC-type multidrug transport system permease subunit